MIRKLYVSVCTKKVKAPFPMDCSVPPDRIYCPTVLMVQCIEAFIHIQKEVPHRSQGVFDLHTMK